MRGRASITYFGSLFFNAVMTSSISLEWAVGSESEGIMVVGRRKERLGIDKMLLYIVKGV